MDIKTRDYIVADCNHNVIIFDIDGEIRRSDMTDATLHQLVKAQLERGRRDFLLNFEKVEFVDSFGVGEILASYISISNLGGKLKLVRISKRLYLIFQVTNLIRILSIYEDEAAALESFGKP
jgi:anti-anti-sigma factor